MLFYKLAMNKNCTLNLTIYIFFLFSIRTSSSVAQLKVEEVIQKIITNNPDLQANSKKINQATGILLQAKGSFNTTYSANFNKALAKTDYTYESPTLSTPIDSWNYSVGVSRKLPWGMVISPSVGVKNYGYVESYPGKGDVLTNHGVASLRVVQPLLLGLGKKYNMANIRNAQLAISATEHEYIYQASEIILQSLETYIQYIGAYQNLLIQIQTEASLNKAIVDVNRLIKLDALPASEVIILEAQLSNQRAMHKLAENKMESVKNQLGALMGLKEEEIYSMPLPDTVFPVTFSNSTINEDFIKNWLDKSFVNRHDYMALEKNIQSAELDCFVSKKSVKPRLDLTLTTGYTGLSQALNSEQYYQSLTQNIPGVNYMVGLSFVFLGKNDYAKGKEIETLSTLDILEEQKKKLILNIHNQIKQTGNNYKNNAQVVGFLSESEKNYKKAYQNEIRKFQAGTSTSFIVVQVQNDYLLSKNQLVSLLTDLNISVLEFRHNTGTLIEAQSDNTFNINPTKIFTLPLAK